MTAKEVTIEQVYAAEPKLRLIIAAAKRARSVAYEDGYIWMRYSQLKAELSKLIGWGRPGAGPLSGDPLTTKEAYDVAIRALSDALGV